jgi:hypothetical protein
MYKRFFDIVDFTSDETDSDHSVDEAYIVTRCELFHEERYDRCYDQCRQFCENYANQWPFLKWIDISTLTGTVIAYDVAENAMPHKGRIQRWKRIYKRSAYKNSALMTFCRLFKIYNTDSISSVFNHAWKYYTNPNVLAISSPYRNTSVRSR